MKSNRVHGVIDDAFNFALTWARERSESSDGILIRYGLIVYAVQKAMHERGISPLGEGEFFDKCVNSVWNEVQESRLCESNRVGGTPPENLLDEKWSEFMASAE